MKSMTVATVAMVAVTLAGCSGWISEGPTNQQVKDATGLTVAGARPIVADNFELIWPKPITVEPDMVDVGSGCRTDPNSLRSAGPPWHPRYERQELNPSQEFIDQAMANLEAMTARGFTLVPSQNPAEDPVSRYYRDSRGFSVASSRTRAGRNDEEVRFIMASTSPCAAE
ncbi:hypothetical protein ACIO52_17265 [Nocardia sp. NPDC087230]|uniref:hypothetical protein n=1 Tax=Nocardia sp. NPDC087230 TaxID=3364331 RepID=UPI003808BB45